jgi:hypothetical protein
MKFATKLSVVVMITGLFLVVGCEKKGSCEKLAKLTKKCNKYSKKKDVKDLIKKCEVDLKRGNPMVKISVACSGKSDCKDFQSCQLSKLMEMDKDEMKNYRKKEEALKAKEMVANVAKFIKKPIKDVYKDTKNVDLVSDCKYISKDAPELKKTACKTLNTFLYGEMVKQLEKAVAAGKYDGKHSWEMESLAKKIGKKNEAHLMNQFAKISKDVAKKLKEKTPYMPYNCDAKRIDKLVAKTPAEKKYYKNIINQCFNKLGLKVLTVKNTAKYFYCAKSTKELIKNIAKYKINNPALTKVAAEVQAKCDKKKK